MSNMRLARRYGVLASGALLSKLITFGSAAILARALGSEGLGIYGTAITLAGFLLIASNAGLDSIGTREVARDPGKIAQVARNVLSLRLLLGALLGALSLTIVWMLGGPLDVALPLSLLGVTLALRNDWALIAIGEDRGVVIASLMREGVFLALAVVVASTTKSVAAAAWAYLLADLIWALATRFVSQRIPRDISRQSGGSALNLVGQGWPIAVMGFMSLTYNKIDTPIITWLRGPREAGVYYAAYTIVFAALCVIAPFSRLVLPEMAGERVDHRAGMGSTVRLCLLVASAGAGLGLLLVSSSNAILTGLYGAPFEPGAAALNVLGWILVFNFPSSVLLQRLVVDGRQRVLAVAASVAAVVNVGVNLVLIPRMGIVGAAIATVASEATLLLIPIAFYARMYAMAPFLRKFAWIGAAAALAWGLGRLLPVQVPIVSSAVTVGCYAMFLLPILRSLRQPVAAA